MFLMDDTYVFQFKSELLGYRPKMWRRFQVMSDITVAELGYNVLTLYEMEGEHLMSIDFLHRGRTKSGRPSKKIDVIARFGFSDDRWDDRDKKATDYIIGELNLGKTAFLVVRYDFGDDWRVMLTLEKVFDESELGLVELPRVLEGEGYGIIEDCGGPYGLMQLAEAIKTREGPVYEHYSEWLDEEDVDLYTFDVDDMNINLQIGMGRYIRRYEEGRWP